MGENGPHRCMGYRMEPERIQYHDLTTHGAEYWPRVDVVMINSRGMENPWVQQAIGSVQASRYPNLGLLIVDNTDHALTIGKAWNLGVAASTADNVFFLGDDDYISWDLIMSLVTFLQFLGQQPNGENVVMVSSGCTAIDAEGRTMAEIPQQHTGMYLRAWLVDHPFNPTMARYVDTEMHERLKNLQQLRRHLIATGIAHHKGYFYRQHIGMVSGEKVRRQQPQGAGIEQFVRKA